MSDIKTIQNRLNEIDGKQRVHELKLELLKEEICKNPTPEEVKETERYHKRMEELMKDDGDPFSYCFESGSVDRNKENSMILTILNGSNLLCEITNKLNSNAGRFREVEALSIMEKLLDYLVDDHRANKKPIPTQHTYIPSDYYVFRDRIVFEPSEEFDVRCDKKWALGVIFYYLVTGYPALDKPEQIEFYKNIGLGPKLNTQSRNLLIQKRHSFPSKRWENLSKNVRECIKGLTSYHPGNRTLTDDLCFNLFPYYDSDDNEKNIDDTTKDQKLSMDIASFKTIIDVQKKDMKQFLKDNNHNSDPVRNHRKAEWNTFFKKARMQSRRKVKKIKLAKYKKEREVKENSENEIQRWLELYNNRLQSEDAYEEYNRASVPLGAWGRVD